MNKQYVLATMLTLCASSLALAQPALPQTGSQSDPAQVEKFKKIILEDISKHKACVEAAKTIDDLARCRPRPPGGSEHNQSTQGGMR